MIIKPKRAKIKDPGRQIAMIMRKDAQLIDGCNGNITRMLNVLTDSNMKIKMLLEGIRGNIN